MAQGKDKAWVGRVIKANYMTCKLQFFKLEEWVEVESGNTKVEITSVEIPVPVVSILYKLEEDVAKNLLLIQGIEL